MNNTTLIAVAIIAAAVILKLPIGPQPGRFQIATGQWGAVRLDTMTGDAWLSSGTGPWMPFRDNGARP